MNAWRDRVEAAIVQHGAAGYVVDFPSYRPDLVEELAMGLGLTHVDFRATRLAPLRREAHKLTLDAIEAAIAETAGTGVVIHNAEALLAARNRPEREAFLAGFMARERDRPAVLPMTLFGKEAPDGPRHVRLLPHELPEETLLRQLSSIRTWG
jgi:hypothetical protein